MQAHDARHLSALLVEGNEGHGTSRIVVDELVEQFVAYFAHWSEEAQPKIFRGHVAEKIGIEGSIFRLGRRIRTDVPSRRIKCGSLNAISSQVRQPMMPAAARLAWSILHRLLSAIS